jgi:Zn-dependent protease
LPGNINPSEILLQYLVLLFSLCFHEAAHAAMANRCGDPTARLLGRMTLNPLPHIDIIGTVVMPLVMMLTNIPYLIGWAKPVPVNPRNFRDMRRDDILVSLAGPGSNLLLALTSILTLRILVIAGQMTGSMEILKGPVGLFLLFMITINLLLMVFNLIPIPPLDGHHVLYQYLPPQGQRVMEQIGPFGLLLIIFIAGPILSTVMPVLFKGVYWLAFAGTSLG